MKLSLSHSLLVALALVVWSLPASAQTVPGRAGTIAGQITSAETRAPLVGARVEVISPVGETIVGTLTDQAGRYRLENVAPGTYTLVVNTIGFEGQRVENVQVSAGQTTSVNAELVSRAIQLNPVVVTASRRQERVIDAPASVQVVSEEEIDLRPAVTPVDHLRNVPGVDIATHGVQSANVVARGFNNIFSGSLYMLTDHRIAGVPSLRVNLMHMIPATNEDMERIEVVLGPGSALYGPNTANGVLHVFTRSPLTSQGTSVSLTGGERELLNPSFRTAHQVTDNFGIKLSGEYMRAQEWEHQDSVEVVARREAIGRGALADTLRIGNRDFQLERWAGEARADWRITPDLTAVFSVGRSQLMRGVELTGIGAAQVNDWGYTYYQARGNWNRVFGQVYLNQSDAGDTYLLRTGEPIVDRSELLVGQLQHGLSLGTRQNFTYGVDFLHTRPNTGGTIHGRYEDDDDIREVGAYLQSETAVTPQLDLVFAARVDDHNRLENPVFSPRAAVVFKPLPEQAFRLTYNRAFSTPRSLDFFLDIDAGPFPDPRLAQFGPLPGYGIRAQGGGGTGFSFQRADGSYAMRSPFHPLAQQPGSPAQLITANVPTMWDLAVGVLHANSAFGPPTSPQAIQTAALLRSLQPTDTDIVRVARDVLSGEAAPLQTAMERGVIRDVSVLEPSYETTFEVGYKGILADRVLLAADVWISRRNNFVSALRPVTPLVLLEEGSIAQFLIARGLNPVQAGQIAAGMATVPLGVIAAENVSSAANRADFLATYRNFGELNLWGGDVAATMLLTDAVTLGLTASYTNRDTFETEGELITLNAPTTKLTGTLGYRARSGFNGELRLRYNAEFPVLSAPFIATRCIADADLPDGWERPAVEDPCVESFALADLTLGYRFARAGGTTIQLMVQNLFDTAYRSFPGVPDIGRMAVVRLRYEF